MKKIAKGWHSEVFLTDKNTVIKKFKPELKINFWKEVYFLNLLSNYDFVPKVFNYDSKKLEIEMEYIDGASLAHFLKNSNDKEKVKTIITKILDICYLLDKLRIHKDELTNPKKDILIKGDKVFVIDWERAKKTSKPRNVSQFVIFLYKNKKLLEEKGIYLPNFTSILPILKRYSKSYEEEYFKMLKKKIFQDF